MVQHQNMTRIIIDVDEPDPSYMGLYMGHLDLRAMSNNQQRLDTQKIKVCMVSMGRLMADVCLDAHNFHVQKTLLDLWSSPRKCLQHDSIIFHFLIQFPSFPIMYLCFTYYSHHFPRDVYKYNKITYTYIYDTYIYVCV